MYLKLSRYLVVTDPIPSHLDGRGRRLLLGTRTGAVIAVDLPCWDSLSDGNFGDLPLPLFGQLKDSRIIVNSQEDELAAVLGENREAAANTGRLFVAIQPTADCQFACEYCGQAHRHNQLGEDDQWKLVQRLQDKLHSGRYSELKVGWFGGEPLLAMDIIRELTPRLRAIAAAAGCTYQAEIVTNGLLLTPRTAGELCHEHAVREIDVTLDGIDIFHDQRRVGKDGFPTFRRIFNNVVVLARRADLEEVNLRIRCNVDHNNRDGVTPMIQRLADYRLHDRLQRLYMVPVHPWVNDHRGLPVSPETYATWEIPWLLQMKHLGFNNTDLIPPRLPIICFAVEPEAENVDAFGNLFNCSEFSYVPDYEQPAAAPGIMGKPSNLHAIGSLARGEEPGKRDLLGKFYDHIEQGKLPCHTCEILPVCGGACPKAWHIGLVPCPPLKFNISQRLALNYSLTKLNYPSIARCKNQNFQNCLSRKSLR